MKLAIPALLLLRSIHATAASEANATMLEPISGTSFVRDIPRDLAEAGAGSIESPQQIVGGFPTGSAVDYMVGIGYSYSYFSPSCGGTLIAPGIVLTAAHCMKNFPDRVFVNLYNKRDVNNPTDVEVIDFGTDYVKHPNYNAATAENDVALIFLPHAVKNANTIQYPNLNEDWIADGDLLTVMGWGRTSSGGTTSDVLLYAEVGYVTNEECSSDYASLRPVTDDMLCAAEAGKDACQGDSGGPLLLNNANSDLRTNPVVVGIVSWGRGCALPKYPGVYARVSHFADWIKEMARELADELCPEPSTEPSAEPSLSPSASLSPSIPPSQSPSIQPSSIPSGSPLASPSGMPSSIPSDSPLASPSTQPSAKPSSTPSLLPSTQPSTSIQPTSKSNKSKTPKTKKRTKADKTTIRASFNKSGASYPSPGALIGVVLALNVLIVSIMSTVM